jgi:alpha-galactosidase
MTAHEEKTPMSLWSILAAPLLAGNDLRNVPPSTLEILTNREVIAVNQDKDGKQGQRVWKSGDQEIWVRQLAGGEQAVAVFNRSAESATIAIKWADLGIQKSPTRARDLWAHTDVKLEGPDYSVTVPAHGVALLRL